MQENEAKIQAYSKQQLAIMYKIDRRTFVRWIKPFENEIGNYIGKCFTPKQVEIIFRKLGNP